MAPTVGHTDIVRYALLHSGLVLWVLGSAAIACARIESSESGEAAVASSSDLHCDGAERVDLGASSQVRFAGEANGRLYLAAKTGDACVSVDLAGGSERDCPLPNGSVMGKIVGGDESGVFFTAGTSDHDLLVRIRPGNASGEVVAKTPIKELRNVFADGDRIVWNRLEEGRGMRLQSIKKTGTTVSSLASPRHDETIVAADQRAFYFRTDDELWRIDRTSGEKSIVMKVIADLTNLVADGNDFVARRPTSTTSEIIRFSRESDGTQTPKVDVQIPKSHRIEATWFEDTVAYWLVRYPDGGLSVFHTPRASLVGAKILCETAAPPPAPVAPPPVLSLDASAPDAAPSVDSGTALSLDGGADAGDAGVAQEPSYDNDYDFNEPVPDEVADDADAGPLLKVRKKREGSGCSLTPGFSTTAGDWLTSGFALLLLGLTRRRRARSKTSATSRAS